MPNSLLECDSDIIGDIFPRHWSLQPCSLCVTCHMSAPGGCQWSRSWYDVSDVTDASAAPLVPIQLVTSASVSQVATGQVPA